MNNSNVAKYYPISRYTAGRPEWEVDEMLPVGDGYDDETLAEVMDDLDVDEFVLYELVPRKIVRRRPSVVTEDIK